MAIWYATHSWLSSYIRGCDCRCYLCANRAIRDDASEIADEFNIANTFTWHEQIAVVLLLVLTLVVCYSMYVQCAAFNTPRHAENDRQINNKQQWVSALQMGCRARRTYTYGYMCHLYELKALCAKAKSVKSERARSNRAPHNAVLAGTASIGPTVSVSYVPKRSTSNQTIWNMKWIPNAGGKCFLQASKNICTTHDTHERWASKNE